MSVPALKQEIVTFLEDRKALNIYEINLEGKTSLANYLIIASGTSQRHVAAMAELLSQHLKQIDQGDIHVEGLPDANWVLIDLGAIIIHLFRPDVRAFYDLEKLWG